MVAPIKIALLFPGQGSQYVGMGKDIASQFPKAAEVFEKANAVLGVDLRKICFEGPEKDLVLTQNNQPGILTTSIACWEAFRQEAPAFEVVGCAGLSLGEYTALVAAGALRFEDALKLVRARGTYMQQACDAVPSTMASVIGLEEKQVREICASFGGNGSGLVLDVANVNCPGQIVVSGHKEAVGKAVEHVATLESARAIPLNVSGAFHSRLMQPAADKLGAEIGGFAFSNPNIPVFTNVTGKRVADAACIPDFLIRQITSSVLWDPCVRSILDLKPDLFVELGCGKVLSGLLRKIDKTAKSCNIEDVASLRKAIDAMTAVRAN